MLLVEHIFLAVLITIVLAICYELTKLHVDETSLLLFGIGMILVNILDIDHYSGSIGVLWNCALVVLRSDPYLQVCTTELRRGVAHSYYFLGAMGAVMLYAYWFIQSEFRQFGRGYAALSIGLWVGWMVHLVCDFSAI